MEAVGALASAVQLLDVTLRYSSVIAGFVSGLRHARDDIRELQRSLDEVRQLLAQLQGYATDVKQLTSVATTQRHLAQLIFKISQHFAEDMDALYRLIPSDVSLRKRARFVFQGAERAAILRRLGERKADAALAIAMIGGLDNIKQQGAIQAISQSLHDLCVGQQASEQANASRHETSMIQLQQEHARLHASVAELRDTIQRLAEEGRRRDSVETLRDNLLAAHSNTQMLLAQQNDVLSSSQTMMESNMSGLQSQLREIQQSQDGHLQRISTAVSQTLLSADSEEILARIVRVETRRALQPLINRFDGVEGVIDQISTTLSNPARYQTNRETAVVPVRPDGGEDLAILKEVESNPTTFSSRDLNGTPRSAVFKEIQLSSYSKWIHTRWGWLYIRVTTYRVRSPFTRGNSIHFGFQINFTPRPCLFSRGISVVHMSGPDNSGFYSICPRIMTYPVYSDESPIMRLLEADDVNGIREMLHRGELSIRARDEHGDGLLRASMFAGAYNICSYLLRDTRYGELLSAMDQLDMNTFLLHSAANFLGRTSIEAIGNLIILFRHYATEDNGGEEGPPPYIWYFLHESCQKNQMLDDLVPAVRLVQSYGVTLKLFRWFRSLFWFTRRSDICWYIQYDMCMVQVYFITGGNPNQLSQPWYEDEDRHPLVWLMLRSADLRDYLSEHFETSFSDKDELSQQEHHPDTDEDEFPQQEHHPGTGMDEVMMGLCIELFECIISHGGNIYYIWDRNDCPETAKTLTHLAEDLGIMNIWGAALTACGHHVEAVVVESHRRIDEYRKLHGAGRTAVDVCLLTFDEEAGSGMRRRRGKGKEGDGGDE
ncbi:hypothetical protein B0T21DRAFT_454633 [Apiosordaria backusii]|uniref:Fungal N-terminal domain-containing protein n=1 Tax=Apiosordaria backusii TaxID=314023 RepID=A0AA40AEN1_9PEZI|nr:hypothetical protein B0T21DRAFT_454633 [Apiosordaria backusii]